MLTNFSILPATNLQKIPVLRATSKKITIRDGENLKKDFWTIDPSIDKDIYYSDLPRKTHLVTFISDIDSLSFYINGYGDVHEFIILLNQKDSCRTALSAQYNGVFPYISPKSSKQIPDTIPFGLQGSRIYFNGCINGQQNMNIQFDLGAGMCCVNKASTEKANVVFDGKTILINTSGTNEEPTSSSNRIKIGNLRWEGIPVVQSRNMGRREDAIIGNSLFENKIIEIDYDHNRMILHDTLPKLSDTYTRHPVIYVQHRPFIQASVVIDHKKYTDWFLFDTGRDGTMVLRDDFFRKNDIWNQLTPVFWLGKKEIKLIPALQIGNSVFTDVISPAYLPHNDTTDAPNILGNELLNHFNVIIDNQEGIVYLKPNSLRHNPYENLTRFRNKIIATGTGIVLLLGGIVCILRKIRRRHTNKIKL